jgi:hypothetical protein
VNVLYKLFGSFVKLFSRRSIPVKQVGRAYLIRTLPNQYDFVISVSADMATNDKLTNRCSYGGGIPGLSGLYHIFDQ